MKKNPNVKKTTKIMKSEKENNMNNVSIPMNTETAKTTDMTRINIVEAETTRKKVWKDPKNKQMPPEIRAKHVVAMAYKGADWDEICGTLEVHVTTCQKALYQHYEKSGGKDSPHYKKLIRIIRENKKNKTEKQAKANEVILVETGYILEVGTFGVRKLLNNTRATVIIPAFCLGELEKLAADHTEAERFFELQLDKKIIPVYTNEEVLYHEPTSDERVTKRMYGIVALAVDLDLMGMKVCVYTNSPHVKELVEKQEAPDMTVELVS